ncbi:hypothetical protein [Phenylobacterium sp.]|jgi:hypothetical protein|uniref:hypothetical protein n=1 Tax=Phenylobacterium sp. TaxID=1871053 RepID=UPI002E303A5B|nr:hypothetical protein [Phenylobacterium sp.]HEX2559371.1 hypothetical protein [Phenylobacterium sp.]
MSERDDLDQRVAMAINVTMTAILLILAVSLALWTFAKDLVAVLSTYQSLGEVDQRSLDAVFQSTSLLAATVPLALWGVGKGLDLLKRRRG